MINQFQSFAGFVAFIALFIASVFTLYYAIGCVGWVYHTVRNLFRRNNHAEN